MAEQLRALITGRVQLVGFRAFVQRHATRLGLAGYVRNTPEGHVEVLAEGPRPALEELLALLRTGPPAARVSAVLPEWRPAGGRLHGFLVRQ